MVFQKRPSSWHLQSVRAMSKGQERFARVGLFHPDQSLSSFLGCLTGECLLQEHVPPPKDAVVQRTGEMKDKREEKRGTCPAVASLNPLVERLVGGHQPVISQ
jgi:hypothetical protein